APSESWRSSVSRSEVRGPRDGPPPAFVAPRVNRGAPRSRAQKYGAPTWPPTPPSARRAPAESWRSSVSRSVRDGGHLRVVEFQPDAFVDLEDLVRARGHAQLQRAVLGTHRVVPVLAEVGALADAAGQHGGTIGRCRRVAMQVHALRP